MKIKHGLFVTLLCFSLSLMSTAAPATNAKTPAYEDLWWAKNPTLMQFVQQQRQGLKTIAVVAATNFASMSQEVQNDTGSWRIENPTLHESSATPEPVSETDSVDCDTSHASPHGFRLYGENPTL